MTLFYPSHAPYSAGSDNFLWISLIPKKLSYTGVFSGIHNTGNQNVGIFAERDGERMMFLAPNELMDNASHTWEPIENIISSFQEKLAGAKRSLQMGKQQHKVDTPLLYNNSDRRQFELLLYLSVYTDPVKDLYEPINTLMRYSAPDLAGRSTYTTEVGHPHIFKLDTVLGTSRIIPLINIRYAALTAVQPSYQGPYQNGYPSYCELTLTFNDMEPMMKETFSRVPTVTTISPMAQ